MVCSQSSLARITDPDVQMKSQALVDRIVIRLSYFFIFSTFDVVEFDDTQALQYYAAYFAAAGGRPLYSSYWRISGRL
jgi:hypothetical protein